jgi:nucleoside-diphosphate-sugar epimerase
MGGILSDLRDVCLRFVLEPIVLLTGRGRPIDMIYGGDAARAVVLAIRGLLERPDEIGAEAFFITKGRATTNEEYFTWAAQMLGRRVFVMPAPMRALVVALLWLGYSLRRMARRPVPGVPLHQFVCIQNYQQTFDNTKALRMLGFSAHYDLHTGVQRLVEAHHHRVDQAQPHALAPPETAFE